MSGASTTWIRSSVFCIFNTSLKTIQRSKTIYLPPCEVFALPQDLLKHNALLCDAHARIFDPARRAGQAGATDRGADTPLAASLKDGQDVPPQRQGYSPTS